MGLSKTLKINAKRAMSGAWGRGAAILVIGVLPVILINFLEYIVRGFCNVPEFVDYAGTPGLAFDDLSNLAIASTLITVAVLLLLFIITTPLQQGILRWYYRRTGGENDSVSEIFFYFESARDYFKAFWLCFQIGLRFFFWEVLIWSPLIAGGVLLNYTMQGLEGELPEVTMLAATLIGVIWAVIACILSVIVSLRYALTPYLLAEHPQMRVRHIIRQSVRLTRGHKGGLFVFGLSFIGWMLLSVLMIPYFFVVPYYNASFAMYGRYLIARDEEGANATREYRPETGELVQEPAPKASAGGVEESEKEAFLRDEPEQ